MPSPIDAPRAEYPRPQFARPDWLCLNGRWDFEIDRADSGLERGLLDTPLSGEITVPFCPESELSGIGDVDFMETVWYRREVEIPAAWSDRRVLLHFQAVDYDATVWVNGVEVARHRGGFTPFSADLGGAAAAGERAVITVRARDPKRGPQARGKQATFYANTSCFYTRTTGIWQSVWLEPVADVHLRRPRITPDLAAGAFELTLPLSAGAPGHRVRAVLSDGEGAVASAEAPADRDLAPRVTLPIPAERVRAWSPDDPHLYGLRLELLGPDGAVVDAADSYAGLRSVTIEGNAVLINGERIFQRLVLDQGFYPDGIMTAPSEEALVADITLAQRAGFNGARLHQKVFEERYLYHADRLGYLVWGEFADWGCQVGGRSNADNQQPDPSYIGQWLEAVERDYSHPSIVGWCPLNETYQDLHDRTTVLDDVTRAMFLATKAFDTTRPVIDASGYSHRVAETDVYDSHNYEQDPAAFAAAMAGLADGTPYTNTSEQGRPWSVAYRGQPYFCSEFGGIWWKPGAADPESWGYGERPASEEEFYKRFEGLVTALLENPDMFGYCYTQLTDVFQETNGIYWFDRTDKVDVDRIAAIQRRTAAFERVGKRHG
ncbi:glycosyl hydrolase family 2 [Murinocardiopsis flavida]|uniref:Glycosyl hydrolase family 2 n=1 Tax=Murinocardiopsis flavida TaxID=645275 RepID=A0A2P8DS39_9ACTN|nr:sugar-binding domain-containing protein [Murinocardiopsis flavida]PSL00030.1 glycosyl hydrolase family 2 [Murinocardiopsis flavida]